MKIVDMFGKKLLILGFLLAGSSVHAQAGKMLPSIENLADFKLQTIGDSGSMIEEVPTNFSSAYFYTDEQDGSLVFAVPSNAGTTKGTHYARTELRQMRADANWALLDPTRHVMRVKAKVITVAEKKPQVIIGQIHGSEKFSEMLKLRWNGYKPGAGIVEARFKTNEPTPTEFGIVLARGLSLGDMIDFTVWMEKGAVTVEVNGNKTTHTYTPEARGTTDKYYFKAGNYFQYNDEPPVIGVVKMYALSVGVEK